MTEARSELVRTEHEYVKLAERNRDDMLRQVKEIERQIEALKNETWSVEQEAEARVATLKAQARMELEIAGHIKDAAERSALSVLDRMREASDSLMKWAGAVGDDMSEMMKREAEEQAERQVAELRAIDAALEDEARAIELLRLTGRYTSGPAA